MKTDTIAAIATGLSNAGISIVRISGDQAFAVIDKIFQTKSKAKRLSEMDSHTVHYGYIVDEEEIIDEVMVIIMRAPRSYTMEDSIEIDCHGGITVTKKVLEAVLKAGARIAEPGEFTKRAFLNGRIDLSQAEAVIDVIHANNELALKNSMKQLKGNVLHKVKDVRHSIILDTAYIEAALDDPEHISLEGFSDKLRDNVIGSIKELSELINTSENGRMIKEGIRTVILGRPNAGKSSLLNLMVGEERAIVTEIAGTTRDTIEETVFLNGLCLNLIDTAGIRETSDLVEKLGVEKSLKSAKEADLIICVIDASTPLNQDDKEILEFIKDRKAIVLLNKSDLDSVIEEEKINLLTNKPILKISAIDQTGIKDLEQTITEMFFEGNISFNDEIYITNMRHKNALVEAKVSLEQVIVSIENEMPEDFFSIDLMNAYEILGTIIGESVDEDLVNTIFKEFCMGK
ncbi:tRNA uridine-5-carboxymethylaminomethyl(34) synthesis GTPase MnmE [Lachnoclostridium phytofermentans]|uniref:tRNA modification GTPase MnmE n=1 Tax=Lachnoclostridium phytofermentans (strain ATCC 700394 / DSM 18823 / ISDg) TaxID=357809 RepID=MNME_LACP7|nr:RecName: Full=tRNA modification GTPase MnmE [Lachnoclostridium phytofermentans ISDg]ABX44288.1 tRNA modification GTPase TrmE [Lachnoclostridium phytofermentans ISDg]